MIAIATGMRPCTRVVVVLFAMSGLFPACSSLSVDTDRDASANFDAYKSYGWAVSSPSRSTASVETLLESRVRSNLERDLAEKGIYKAKSGDPDFLIGYGVTSSVRTTVHPSTYGPYDYGAWSSNGAITQYEEGTLVIDFIDPKTKRVFWRGTATAVLGDTEENKKNLEEGIEKLVEKYPN